MKKFYFIFFMPFAMFSQIQIGQDIDGEADNDFSGWSTSISADGSIIAVGAFLNDGLTGSNSGQVRVYENQSGNWIQIGNDIDGEDSGDHSGESISLSADGSIVAIGATKNEGLNESDSGHVRVYENLSGSWVQIGDDINGGFDNEDFGFSVSLSADGSIVAIGAPKNDVVNVGLTRVYQNQAGTWTQLGNDIVGEAAFDESGWSVSLSSDGSIVAIGSYANDGNGPQSGHVRIYQNQSGNWTQLGNDIDGENQGDTSGYSVSLSSNGSRVAIGAISNGDNGNSSGQVRVYENQSGTWIQLGNDLNGALTGFQFGSSVSLSSNGNILAVGAIGGGTTTVTGQVQVFQLQGNNWVQVGNNIDGEETFDEFGFSVNLSSDGSTLIVGAPQNNGDSGIRIGHTRVFDISQVLSNEETTQRDFLIYPNPTKNKLYIKLNADQELVSINLYNVIGQIIMTRKNFKIDISNLDAGIYYLEIKTNIGTSTKKIIKE